MFEIPRLTLGTAQLGPAYGIANREGRLDDASADAVLSAGWDAGMRWFDTARAYGDSEQRIGAWCRAALGRAGALSDGHPRWHRGIHYP